MRFSKSFWNVPPALLATAALFLIAGVAGAIINTWTEGSVPDTPDYDGSVADLDVYGDGFGVWVNFKCDDDENYFHIGCRSDHPDKVKLSTNQGKVRQTKRDNNAEVWFWAKLLNGDTIGTGQGVEFEFDCDRVQIKGKLNDATGKISAQCALKKCVPVGLTLDQIQSAIACIDGDVDNGDLGKKVQTLKLCRGNQLSGKIKSKGTYK